MEQYPSQLLTNAVEELSKLPGIGRKTALRLALHLLRQDPERALQLGGSLIRMRQEVKYCRCCHNISDTDLCSICADDNRDASLVCVVATVKEVMMIESTHQFHGLYHVLGGLISPIDGIGPKQLQVDSLVDRVLQSMRTDTPVREVILALSATLDGDTTNFYVYRTLSKQTDVKVTILARGVSIGDEIEYADEVTLGRSILNRTLYIDSLQKK